jgi:entericidin B
MRFPTATNETGTGRRRYAWHSAPREPMKPGPTDGRATATDGTDTQQVMEMNKLLALILLVAICGLSACNTIEGAGKDIQSGGDAMSDAARDVKKEM